MSVKKLDYNGLQTLIQIIKYFFLSKLRDYLPLSGGTMAGEINCEASLSKYGIKGTIPEHNIYFTNFIARDTSDNIEHGGQSYKCRYGIFESYINTNGDCITLMASYKNDANSDTRAELVLTYPMNDTPYIRTNSHIKLSNGIEIY